MSPSFSVFERILSKLVNLVILIIKNSKSSKVFIGVNMKTGIYYFSATGNSLTTAKLLAASLDGQCDVISLAALHNKQDIEVDYERVGFVFPIYYGDMPYLIRDTIRKMKFKQNTYIFIFTTYRGHPGDVAKRFDNLLQEKNLSLALSKGIPMPGNSYLSTVEQIKDTLANQKTNIKKLVKSIIEQDKIDYSLLPEVENSAVYKACNMRGIKVDEKCIGCQTCIKVCPMNNIELIEGKIKIKDNCMTCLACFHWCPTAAIYMSKEKEIERREKYHHPDVRLTDIIKQKYNEFVE